MKVSYKAFVAKDMDGGIHFFKNIPERVDILKDYNCWFWADGKYKDFYLPLDELFEDLNWEDTPVKVKIIIEKDDKEL